jgi:hypothetical protein
VGAGSLWPPQTVRVRDFFIFLFFPNFVISRIFGECFEKKEEAKLVKFYTRKIKMSQNFSNFW